MSDLVASVATRSTVEAILREVGYFGITMDGISARTGWNRLRINDALCTFSFSELGHRREKLKGRGKMVTIYFLKEFSSNASSLP